MKQIGLLDCTLRDGGYVNDWNFGHSVITGTYKRLEASGVEYIEVGFLDDRRPFDINRTIAPNTQSFDEIFKNVKKGRAVPVAMIDFGTCALENIGPADQSFIEGIRVIFKKEKIGQALPFCRAVKEKGYKLFIQAISITAYSDMEMLEYIQKINEIKPYAFSIVDTYGLLDNRKIAHYFDLFDNNLDPEIRVGYHAHNNFQLAFSNTVKFFNLYTKRALIADCTVYGMGKSAGNCPSELIAMHLNETYGTKYDLSQFLEILDADLLSVYQRHYWGYKYNFYISAMQNCHPNYVQYLLDKKTLTVSAVNKILESIPQERKLSYDAAYIEKAYLDYQNNVIDDAQVIKKLARKFEGKRVLLLGPGASIREKKSEILAYAGAKDVLTVSVNFYPKDYACGLVFISNAKRYSRFADTLEDGMAAELAVTSNVEAFDRRPDYVVNYESLSSSLPHNSDNALLLCMMFLVRTGVKKVMLAGFDGYLPGKEDYYQSSYSFAGNEAYKLEMNGIVREGLQYLKEKISFEFVTPSLYE